MSKLYWECLISKQTKCLISRMLILSFPLKITIGVTTKTYFWDQFVVRVIWWSKIRVLLVIVWIIKEYNLDSKQTEQVRISKLIPSWLIWITMIVKEIHGKSICFSNRFRAKLLAQDLENQTVLSLMIISSS